MAQVRDYPAPSLRQRARAAAALLHDELVDLTADDAALVPLVAQVRAMYEALGPARGDAIGGAA